MNQREFMSKTKDLHSKLGRWQLYVGEESFADFSMGCFYDDIEKRWKVYINYERGRHRIRLTTENEKEAFEELLSMVNFQIETNRYVDNMRH